MNGKKWAILDVAVSLVGGACALLGILTSIKSSSYNQEQQFKEIESRYGLTPTDQPED